MNSVTRARTTKAMSYKGTRKQRQNQQQPRADRSTIKPACHCQSAQQAVENSQTLQHRRVIYISSEIHQIGDLVVIKKECLVVIKKEEDPFLANKTKQNLPKPQLLTQAR